MNWNDYYINMLEAVAAKSKDPNTKLGCIIVGASNEIRTTGYNSFPRGIRDDVPERLQRPEKYLWIEHAERNGILNAARTGIALEGSRLYTSLVPCMDCARAIVQAGITTVIYDAKRQQAYQGGATWNEQWKRVTDLFTEAGVTMFGWETGKPAVQTWMTDLGLKLESAQVTQ